MRGYICNDMVVDTNFNEVRMESIVDRWQREEDAERYVKGIYKLSIQNVKRIKTLCVAGELTDKQIAEMFGVKTAHITKIRRGQAWKSVRI